MGFISHAWGALNRRRTQAIRDLTSVLRLHAGADRPTFDQLRADGMAIREDTRTAVYQRPKTCNLRSPDGYLMPDVMRKLHDGKRSRAYEKQDSCRKGRIRGN